MSTRPRDSLVSALPPSVTASVVTVGTFDGVHRGHLDLISRVVARARALGLPSILVTFEPHPLEVVNPERAPQLLTVGAEKLEVLAETGLEYVAVLPFTQTLRGYSPEAFVALLRERFHMRELLIGYDHGFGRGRAGDVEMLRTLGARDGFGVEVVPAVLVPGGSALSSTVIRRAVSAAALDDAAAALGRPYGVSGHVVRGERRGRLLGFPTANLERPSPRKLLPPHGVYAIRAHTPRGSFGGMLNLGARPTFGDPELSLEAHLFGESGDLYGAWLRVDFVRRLRDTVRFADAAALRAQLERDAEAARAALREVPARVDVPSEVR